jgi:hypothetical protein
MEDGCYAGICLCSIECFFSNPDVWILHISSCYWLRHIDKGQSTDFARSYRAIVVAVCARRLVFLLQPANGAACFIRKFGHKFNKSAKTKSSDQLWSDLKKAAPITLRKRTSYLFKTDYTGPYPLFFLIYNVIGLGSLFYEISDVLSEHIRNIDISRVAALYLLCAAPISVWLTAWLTSRAWKAVSFEEREVE